MTEQLEDKLELLAKLMRQLPECELEVARVKELLENAESNVSYVRDGIEDVRATVCDLLMPPNIVVAGPIAALEPAPAAVKPADDQPHDGEFGDEADEGVDEPEATPAAPEEPEQMLVDAAEGEGGLPEGFTRWTGADVYTPTPDTDEFSHTVEVIFRDGVRSTGKGWTYVWTWVAGDATQDIIAYRIISQPADQSEGETHTDDVRNNGDEVSTEGEREDLQTSITEDPELQAAVARAEATLAQEAEKPAYVGLQDPDLDAEYEAMREREEAKPKPRFSIWGSRKLEEVS